MKLDSGIQVVDVDKSKFARKKKKKKIKRKKSYFLEPVFKIAQKVDPQPETDSDSNSDNELDKEEEEDLWKTDGEEQLKKVQELHYLNSLKERQVKSPSEYLSNVIHRIPLDGDSPSGLYDVIDSLVLHD